MMERTTFIEFVLIAGLSILAPHSARGGSNSGSMESSASFSCDNRATFGRSFDAWCTNVNANLIKNKCVVAVHLRSPVENCGWQGCGFVSFVNERPTLQGNDVIEYGIATPRGVVNLPAEWEFQNGSVMPKSPFPRHYLTVDQFVAERAKCKSLSKSARDTEISTGTALGKICSLSVETMSLNPYYFCMIQQGVIENK